MMESTPSNAYTARWFATFLDTIPPDLTEREVAFVCAHLPLPDYTRVLDLGCGPGRHAIPLARRGHHVIGWDRDGAAVAAARFAAAAEGLSSAHFEARDMRSLSVEDGPFDGIVCMWASFGWFDEDGNLDLLRRAHAAMRPGGRLLLDVYDAAFFQGRTGERLHARGGTAVRERSRLEHDRLTVELNYVDGLVDRFEWQVFTLDGLMGFAARVGLLAVYACAGFDADAKPCGEVPRMQVVLERSD